jgi:N-acetylmuramoyl-L-alanine amidase
VFKLALILSGLALALAGCYTPLPKKDTSPVSDWAEPVFTNAPRPSVSPRPQPKPVQPVAVRPADTLLHQEWIALRDWAASRNLGAPARSQSPGAGMFAVTTPAGTISIECGSQIAQWNGLALHLGFKPAPIGLTNDLLLHRLDITKNLDPLLTIGAQTSTGRVVMVDAGHGGVEAGTCSSDGACEKTYTLDWALRLAKLLSADGWAVHLTRSEDVEVSLAARVEQSQRAGANVFVSLHFNHSGGGDAPAGVETYCLTPVGVKSTLTRNFPDIVAQTYPNNQFDAANLRLAALVHREMVAVPGNRDRGIRRARFPTVLRGQHCPAVLIEGGFLSNMGEARRVADADHRQKLAEAVAAALKKF